MNILDNPEKRAAALREYQIMDTPPEQAFDDLTRLTSFICDTPIALVTLLDTHRQWFKSAVGMPQAGETPLEHAFCAHAIKHPEVMHVRDATDDTRFAANPYVTGNPHVRFYAGAPLITPEGVPLGTICAVDSIPRNLSDAQREALAALARQVIQMLELRKTIKALNVALAEKEAAEREVTTLQTLLPMCAWCRKVRDDGSFWHSVEHYLEANSDFRVTHGMCPDCNTKMKDELAQRRQKVSK